MTARHLQDLLERRATASGDAVALRTKKSGRWSGESWREWRDVSRALSIALIESGLGKGDRVLLLSNTREEWCMVDFGVLGAGGVTVPVYPTATSEQIATILENCGARRAFVEGPSQLAQFAGSGDALATLEDVVVFEPGSPIEPITRPGAVERTYFPYTTVWRQAFRIRFPKYLRTVGGAEVEDIDDRVRSFSLRFSGPLGTSDLVWRVTPG